MEPSQLKCEKCSKNGVLIVASIDKADQPIVYCADHLVEYAQEKKVHEESKQPETVPPTQNLFDSLKALREARLAAYEKLQNGIQSESLTSETNRATILSGLEAEKALREKVFGDDKK
jgi:hypothetical protein